MGVHSPVRARVMVALTLGLLVAGCQQAPTASTSPHAVSPTIPAGEGLVVGGIDACFGVPPRRNPGFVAGTVTVLRGTVTTVPESGGITKLVLPTEQVASSPVAAHHRYRFVLTPGAYVLRAKYSGITSNMEPWVSVTAVAGRLTRQDIPNECL